MTFLLLKRILAGFIRSSDHLNSFFYHFAAGIFPVPVGCNCPPGVPGRSDPVVFDPPGHGSIVINPIIGGFVVHQVEGGQVRINGENRRLVRVGCSGFLTS